MLYYYLSRQMSCLFSTIYYSKDSDVVVVLTSENTSHNRTLFGTYMGNGRAFWCWELTDVQQGGIYFGLMRAARIPRVYKRRLLTKYIIIQSYKQQNEKGNHKTELYIFLYKNSFV